MNRRTFIASIVFALLFAGITYAVNPSSPFRPQDNIQDPTCLPTDSNCYVTYGLQTQTSGTPLYTDTKTINFGSGLTATDNTNGVVTITASGGGSAAWGSITGTLANQTDLQSAFNAKQATLVSGTNIKTINGTTVLGSGNITTGTLTSFAFTNANGFTGSVSNSTTTPTLSLTLQNATTAQSGQLTSTDWNTFNGKLSNITGLVTAGSNISVSGSGTTGSPYVVSGAALSPITVGTTGNTLYSSGLSGTGQGDTTVANGYNIFLGVDAGNGATNASHSNFFGNRAGYSAISASDSNFLGRDAGYGATNAPYSNFFGTNAGRGATLAIYSNFLGLGAGQNSTNAENSNFLGFQAGYLSSNAANAIFIGRQAGSNDTVNNIAPYDDSATFANTSILIGHRTSTGGFSNSIALGAYATNTAVNQFMIGSTNRPINQVVINGTNPYLNFSGTAGSTGYGIRNNAGTMEYKNSGGSWAAFGGGGSSGTVTSFAFTNGGGFTGSVSNSTTTPTLSLTLQNATTSQSGQLTSTDWNTFNNKQNALALYRENPVSATTPVASGDNAVAIGSNAQALSSNAFALGAAAGSNSTNVQSSLFIGANAGSNASDSFNATFIGQQAGSGTTGAYFSNFIGMYAGQAAAGAYASNFIGRYVGDGATNAYGSTFIGNFTGQGAVNAAHSTFIGEYAGYQDTIDNSSNGKASILIGNYTKTGGFSNSIILGSGTGTLGFISNTAANQFMLAPSITQARFRGIDYTFPSAQAAGSGYVLSNNGSGVLSWVAAGGGSSAITVVGTGNLFSTGVGAGAGVTSTILSNFIGNQAGASATSASLSNFFGNSAGQLATNATRSEFIGTAAGYGATNARESIFIGTAAGRNDTVNNYGDQSSILIGSFTNTGGFSDSILLGSGTDTSTGGSPISNTAANQFMLSPTITKARFRSVDYTFPSAQAAASGYVLTNNGSGVLSWTNVANSGGSLSLQTGGVTNGSQSLLNLTAGSNITLTDNGTGRVTIASTAGGSGAVGYINNSYLGQTSGPGGNGSNAGSVNNVLIGNNAGAGTLTSTTQSIFLGSNAGYNGGGSQQSNFIGWNAGYNASNSYASNFFGSSAGYGATSAFTSNFIGYSAGYNASNASDSSFIGRGSGYNAVNADLSNFIGSQSGESATNAANTIFVGTRAGYYATNAANSIFIGREAGTNNTTVNNTAAYDDTSTFANTSILIGHRSSTGGFSNSIALGAYATNTATNQLMFGSTNRPINQVVINGSSPYLNFSGTAGSTGYGIRNNAGTMEFKNNGGSWAAFGSGGSSIALQTNSSVNGSQSLLNLIAGSNITLTDNSTGGVTIASTGGSSAVNYINNSYIGQTSGPTGDGSDAGGGYNLFIGDNAGYLATNADNSNFLGICAGMGATNASRSNLLGICAGSYAVNASNSIFIGTYAGYNDTVDNTASEDSSILIGSYTNTGGFSNSILLGSGQEFTPISNTAANQFMLAPSITEAQFAGIDYSFPTSQAAGAGYVLSNDGNGVLSWIAAGGAGSSQWSDVSGGINYANGIVGINNAAPTAYLDIKGGAGSGGDSYTYRQYDEGDFGGSAPDLNDATFSGPYSGNEDIVTMVVSIDNEGSTDTFEWSLFSGSIYAGFGGGSPIDGGSGVPITGGTQVLADGISVHFGDLTGHTNNDTWIYEVSGPGTHYENLSMFGGGTPDLDDATFSGDFVGTPGQYLLMTSISNTGTPDQFDWQLYEGSFFDIFGGSPTLVDSGTDVPITGSPQLLSHGVSATFGNITGHSNGDSWTTQITYNVGGSGGGSDITDLMNARNAAGNSLFKITSTGMVGVGRSTPTAMLDIQGIGGGGSSGYAYEQLTATDFGYSDPVLDDATFSGTYTGTEDNVIVTVGIDGNAPDTFEWSMYDGVLAYQNGLAIDAGSGVTITPGTPQLLANGISVTIGADSGHDTGDTWVYGITSPGLFYYNVDPSYWGPSVEDVTISGTYTGGESALAVDIEIDDNAGPDTFSWNFTTVPTYYDNGDGVNIDGATAVTITPGTPQLLADGIYVTFAADTGHTIGDHYAQVIVDNGAGSGGGSTDLFSTRNSSGTQLFKIDANGNLALQGTDAYLNFGTTIGSGGYGFRDNGGLLEYKNSGGMWTTFGAAAGVVALQTDGVLNVRQDLLNLVAGSGITLTDDGDGNIMIASSAGSSAINYVGTSYIGQTSGVNGDGSDEANGGNIFIGDNAGFASSLTAFSTFLGVGTGYNLVDPSYSNFIGYNAGYQSSSIYSNTSYSNFIGYNAGYGATASTSNFIGYNAGYGVGLDNNNFIGYNAGYGGLNAHDSNFIGTNAGYGSGVTHSNFFGTDAGSGATNAYTSIFIGWGAGQNAVNANLSNFIGGGSGQNATNASGSSFFGINAGLGATNAANSIFIGRGAGLNDTVNNTASFDESTTFANTSILIGHNTSAGGFSNSIALGAYATNTAANQMMVGSSTRRINALVFNGGTGNTCSINASTGISCSSDERLKTNIVDLDQTTLAKVLTLKTVTYNWVTDPTGVIMVGFIAQDLQTQFPQLVTENTDGMLSVNYAQMTPIIVEAIKEMNLNIVGIGDLDTPNTWRDSLVAWLGSAGNGITSIFSKEVRTDKLCVGETCVTEAQLQQLLQNQAGGGSVTEPTPDPIPNTPSEEAPIVETPPDEIPQEVTPAEVVPEPQPEAPAVPAE